MVNGESLSFYERENDVYFHTHQYQNVCNDYVSETVGLSAVRTNFAPFVEKPIFLVINGVANSPSHQQYELVVNHSGFGDFDFSQEITGFRLAIDAIEAPALQPVLDQARLLANGHFQCRLVGQRGKTYRLEASTNLLDWTVVATNLPGSSSGRTVEDTQTSGHARRFYRAAEE